MKINKILSHSHLSKRINTKCMAGVEIRLTPGTIIIVPADTDGKEQTEYSLLISYLMRGNVTNDFARGKKSKFILLEGKCHR